MTCPAPNPDGARCAIPGYCSGECLRVEWIDPQMSESTYWSALTGRTTTMT